MEFPQFSCRLTLVWNIEWIIIFCFCLVQVTDHATTALLHYQLPQMPDVVVRSFMVSVPENTFSQMDFSLMILICKELGVISKGSRRNSVNQNLCCGPALSRSSYHARSWVLAVENLLHWEFLSERRVPGGMFQLWQLPVGSSSLGSVACYLGNDKREDRDWEEPIWLYPLSAPTLMLRSCVFWPNAVAGGFGSQGNAYWSICHFLTEQN